MKSVKISTAFNAPGDVNVLILTYAFISLTCQNMNEAMRKSLKSWKNKYS